MVTQEERQAAQSDELLLNQEGNQQIESDDSDPKIVRYKQMMKGSKEEAERALDEAASAHAVTTIKDNDYFLELYEKNPKMAEKVATKFEGITSAKQLADHINGLKNPQQPKPLQQKTVDTSEIARQVREEIAREEAMKAANKQFDNLTEEQETLAKKHFDKMTSGLNLSTGEIVEYAEMAATYARQKVSASGEKDRAMLELASTNVGTRSSSSSKTQKGGAYSKETDNLAASFGFDFSKK